MTRFHNWREPISEGYFPKLDSLVASRTWPARPAGAVLKDINRPVDQLNFDLQDLERWRDRIYEAIHTGSIINPRGQREPLTELGGIDLLGNIMEASILSPNQNVYGDLHNLGHVAISYCHDPDHRYLVTWHARPRELSRRYGVALRRLGEVSRWSPSSIVALARVYVKVPSTDILNERIDARKAVSRNKNYKDSLSSRSYSSSLDMNNLVFLFRVGATGAPSTT